MTTQKLLRLYEQGYRITAPGEIVPIEVEHAPRSINDPYPWRSINHYPQYEMTTVSRYRSSELTAEPPKY